MASVVVAALVASVAVIAPTVTAQAATDFFDDFSGTLDAGWTVRDGYADQFPADTANHAAFATTPDHFSMSFPGGAEHNQWVLRQAEIMRPYDGSGVYEIKVDSDFTGYQQVGLSFESSPGNFMQFMLYSNGDVHAYVERFSNVLGPQTKTTVAGASTGHTVPKSGPWYLRVTVSDEGAPSERTWKFEWATDGINWTTLTNGVLETGAANENAGQIQTVGIFTGNQPSGFSPFEASIDYFHSGNTPLPAPIAPPTVSVQSGDTEAVVSWTSVSGADSYNVYRSDDAGGAVTLVAATVSTAHTQVGLVNGEDYFFSVAAVQGGVEQTLSAEARVVPHPPVLDDVPQTGLILALSADTLVYSLANGDSVQDWSTAAGTPSSASAAGSARPTLVSSGIGGQPSVRFDGVDDYLQLGAGFADFTAGMTMYVVSQPTALQTGHKIIALGSGAGVRNLVLGQAGNTSGLQYFTTNSSGGYGWFNTPSGLVANTALVTSVTQSGGVANAQVTAAVTVNGTQVGSGSVFVPPVGVRSTSYIGRSFWNEGRFQGDIAEILIYNRTLTASEHASINAHITAKYLGEPEPDPVPGAPSGLVATAGDATVGLSWGVTAGADGYRVYRSAGSTPALIADLAAPGYTDTAVSNGITYTYTVTAYNATGESAASNAAAATPTAPEPDPVPGAPSGLVATAGDATVGLSWGVTAGADGYRVYRSAGSTPALITDLAAPGYTDTAVSNGITYTYTVTAYNATGESAASNAAAATPTAPEPDPDPGVPTNGLILSLDASVLVSTLANGSPVSIWADTSSSNHNASASGAARPTLVSSGIGGQPSVRFDGVDDYLQLGAGFADFTAGMTMYVVIRPTALQTGHKIIALGNGAGVRNLILGQAGNTSGLQYFTTNSSGGYGWFNTPTGLTSNEATVISISQPGGAANAQVTAAVTVNGTQVGSGSVFVPPVGVRSTSYIGRSFWNEGRFQGDIAEILIYNRTLTANEHASINAHITAKYGIAV